MRPYDYEEDDQDQGQFGRKAPDPVPEWHDSSDLTCRLCEHRTRMPGHWLCSYCDYVGLEARVTDGVLAFEALLAKNAPWSEYQVAHGLI